MTIQPMLRLPLHVLAILGPLTLAGCATSGANLPDRFAAGRDSDGGRCTANRTWKGAGVTSPQDVGYILNCGGVAASRAQAIVSVVPAATRASEDESGCGAVGTADLRGIGAVEVRRCNDALLKASAVVVRFSRAGKSYRGAAVASALGPLENALAALVNGATPTDDTANGGAQIRLDTLAAAPQGTVSVAGAGTVDPALVLREGISLNRQGRYVEASRLLNDGLSRTAASTAPEVVAELLLEAGLADSNIRFSEAAKEHFDAAAVLLDRNSSMVGGVFLQRKRAAYAALDSLNRRDYDAALTAAASSPRDAVIDPGQPLESPAVLAELNRADRAGGSAQSRLASIGGSKSDLVQTASLNAQLGWARSVALLAQNKGPDAAEEALADSTRALETVLNDNIDPGPFTYLVAIVERQAGRISARRARGLSGDARNVAYARAIGQFDCGLAALRGRAAPDPAACAVQLNAGGRARLARAGGSISPVVAETQIERAAMRVAAGATLADTNKDFSDGFDTLIASGRAGSLPPSGLETYLDLLAANAQGTDPANIEAFFRAVQAIGEPGIARQLSQIQAVVGADEGSAGLLRERADLTREIPALRYQIEAIGDAPADGAQRKALTDSRDAKLKRLETLNDQLIASGKLNAVDDTPVTVQTLQKTLLADEVYFKLVEVRGYSFGMVVSRDSAQIYRIDANLGALTDLVANVRTSIRDGSDKIPVFSVANSAALFLKIAGPDATRVRLQGAKKIVFDPSGPMSTLPLGVLIADKDSAIAYLQRVRSSPTRENLNDYSQVRFMARQAEIATALSPRSFIDARGLKQSVAANPFIGIGEHSAPAVALRADAKLQFGPNCFLDRAELVRISLANPPISAAKLADAAAAFGVPGAPEITGANFTDQALEGRTDLDKYQVIHFATHGLPERQFGCATIPPSLLTTIGGEGSDGFLSFSEVASLKLNANLVVLSACDTSASTSQQGGRRFGQEDTGRALDGLVRAFLAANARAVVATYWEVSADTETDELFRAFYSNGKTRSIGGALQAAQTKLIDQPRYSHPYYWGAYFLVGDESKTMLSGAAVATK